MLIKLNTSKYCLPESYFRMILVTPEEEVRQLMVQFLMD